MFSIPCQSSNSISTIYGFQFCASEEQEHSGSIEKKIINLVHQIIMLQLLNLIRPRWNGTVDCSRKGFLFCQEGKALTWRAYKACDFSSWPRYPVSIHLMKKYSQVTGTFSKMHFEIYQQQFWKWIFQAHEKLSKAGKIRSEAINCIPTYTLCFP